MPATEKDVAYMAGVIDSDGSIGIVRKTPYVRTDGSEVAAYGPRISVSQVTPEAVDLLHASFGGIRSVERARVASRRPLEHWEVSYRCADHALRSLIPYLRIKRRQAEIGLTVLEVVKAESRPRHPLPPGTVDPTAPLMLAKDAATLVGVTYGRIQAAIASGQCPAVRKKASNGRMRLYVPESFAQQWASRPRHLLRSADTSSRLHELFLEAKELNRVGSRLS